MQEALREYERRVTELRSILTHDLEFITPDKAFQKSLKKDEKKYRKLTFKKRQELFKFEPYRRKLSFMLFRLNETLKAVQNRLHGKTITNFKGSYNGIDEFLNDLYLIRDSLISHNDGDVAKRELKDLIRLAETCGFSLYELDIRQESTIHTNTVNEVLKQFAPEIDYASLDETARIKLLSEYIERQYLPKANPESLSEKSI